MKLYDFQSQVDDDSALLNCDDFIEFTREYLEFVGSGKAVHPNIQADIVSLKEPKYHFFQYKDDGRNCITRPINTEIFMSVDEFGEAVDDFNRSIHDPRSIYENEILRNNINRVIYTCQQSIGCILDSFNNPNKARKRNGMFFEKLLRNIISAAGVICISGDEKIKIPGGNKQEMKFQHDVILKREDDSVAGIGQLKTSSKDRLDKIFLDKYMHNKLSGVDIPHFAIFLNDVQRASNKDGNYSINSTFLPGHFKAYTMALAPLDGVYYFDPRPPMLEDADLSKYIYKFDKFLVEDMWKLLK